MCWPTGLLRQRRGAGLQGHPGVTPYVPKPLTSGSKAKGRFGKQDFVYLAGEDVYRCPAGETLTRHFTSVEDGMNLCVYWTANAPAPAR